MTASRVLAITTTLSLATVLSSVGGPVAAQTTKPEQIAVNDNRTAAGTMEGGIFTVHLETREGEWHPDADTDPGLKVLAFAVEGSPLQVPGPLIRVTEGTEIHAFVRNRLDKDTLFLHGMYARSPESSADPIAIDPGQVREIRFTASVPGTYYYWGVMSNATLTQRFGRDTQLSGAFLVEPRGSPSQNERVFVIGVWTPVAGLQQPGDVNRMVMNGKSRPHKQRMT